MFDNKPRQGIGFRFLRMITLILIVNTVALSVIIASNESKMLRHALMTKGLSLANYIAKLSLDPLIMKNAIQLDSIVNEANEDEDIMYAVVRDGRGIPVTSQFASLNYRSQRVKAILSRLAKQGELQEVVAALKQRDAIAELSVPIATGSDVVGSVTIGMSEQGVRHRITMTVLFVVALNLVAALALGAVLFVATKRVVLDPVSELAGATVRLAGGDLSTRVEVKASGEVQLLVDCFNQMARDLDKRTGELVDAQEELVRKEKLSILGQLSGSVGHELRNPLGVMSNAIYFLKTVLADADDIVKEYLEMIKHEIDNSQRIISDLLDFSRTKPPRSMATTVEDLVLQSIGRCTIPESVEVHTDVPATLPKVLIDPLQMGQVFQNLISNAVQAMPEGGELRIAARGVESTSDFVEILVEDTGEGIAPENMKKLFQPLFTTKPKGIGLGLVVCRNLAEANGGRMEVQSRLGEGTTFTVIVPAVSG